MLKQLEAYIAELHETIEYLEKDYSDIVDGITKVVNKDATMTELDTQKHVYADVLTRLEYIKTNGLDED